MIFGLSSADTSYEGSDYKAVDKVLVGIQDRSGLTSSVEITGIGADTKYFTLTRDLFDQDIAFDQIKNISFTIEGQELGELGNHNFKVHWNGVKFIPDLDL